MKTKNYLHDPFTLEFDYYPTSESYGPVVFFNFMNADGNEQDAHVHFDPQGGVSTGSFSNDLEGSYSG